MVAEGVLDLGIELDVWPWIWLVVAVVFALVELAFIGGSFVLLPFAASAFVASILGFYDLSIELQWAVFVFGGGVAFAALYRWARGLMQTSVKPLGVGADRLVGLTGIVTAPILPDDTDRRGRITVAGEVWGAITDLDEVIGEGTRVRILSMQGTRVVVEPIAPDLTTPQEGHR